MSFDGVVQASPCRFTVGLGLDIEVDVVEYLNLCGVGPQMQLDIFGSG